MRYARERRTRRISSKKGDKETRSRREWEVGIDERKRKEERDREEAVALDHRLSAGIGLWARPLVRPGWTNESLGAPGEKNSPERNHTSGAAGSGETITLWDSAITGYRWFTAWIRISILSPRSCSREKKLFFYFQS